MLLPAHAFRVVKHYQKFSERQIATTLSAQLSWSHFVDLIEVECGVKRVSYSDLPIRGE